MDQNPSLPGIQDKTYSQPEFKAAVDLSAWDMATACGSCHVGGGFVEKDRNGLRLSQRQPAGEGIFDAYLYYVNEKFDPATGSPQHEVARAPWSYPYPVEIPGGGSMTVNMPNVKEMDCLFCHFEGYNNLMQSVMVYSGALNAAPSVGAGLLDTNPLSPTYQGYNTALVNIDPTTNVVSLNSAALDKIKAKPPAQNCRNCHTPTSLTDLPSMMKDFLSSAPMAYTGNFTTSFTGLDMPAFDFNAPFGNTWDWKIGPYATSPSIAKSDIFALLMGDTTKSYTFIPSIGFPAAMGKTAYNAAVLNDNIIGGSNPAGTGPLYYQAPLDPMAPNGYQDQNALKKGIVPFPRADWFKRGDLWDNGNQEVHISFSCEGCHMDTKTTKVDKFDANGNITYEGKSQCDPGRGYDSAGGVEGGVTNASTVNHLGITVEGRNTVKKCADCHITGKNSDGVAIDTLGAPDPTSRHAAAGLTTNMTKSVRMKADGSGEETFIGNHLDVIDCAVCHVYKKQMVVRALDSTSGNRYPAMLGFDYTKGMLGMFTDPTPQMHNELAEWTPIYTWMKIGDASKTLADGKGNAAWRRKVYPVNIITAALWNNVDTMLDANGDGVKGRPAEPNKTYYDPWIQRDMKAGMNFGPSGFAPIPVGFGNGSYMTAYNADGTFTGSWKYVGVYGGNIIFSTPEEIEGYKNFRNALQDGKPWTGTQLLYLGGPYMVTHNIRNISQFVLGKPARDTEGKITSLGCGDCHATNKSFFAGTVNMTGTAIKTTSGGQFMASPAEYVEVVAKAEHLETGAELATKTGAAVEVKFEELGDWNGSAFTPNPAGAYKRVKDLSRAEALYPQGPYTDVKGNTYASLNDWLAYQTSITAESAGLGVSPVAAINAITDVDPVKAGVQVFAGTLNLAAADAQVYNSQPVGTSTYTWRFSDGYKISDTEFLSGQTASRPISTLGVLSITLDVVDEEGKTSVATSSVEVVAPASLSISYDNTTKIAKFDGLPAASAKLKIYWGDGSYKTVTANGSAPVEVAKTYATAGVKTIKLYIYDITGIQIGYKTQTITVQ